MEVLWDALAVALLEAELAEFRPAVQRRRVVTIAMGRVERLQALIAKESADV